MEDKLKATTAYLAAKNELFTKAWLGEHRILQKDITLYIKEAKERLKELQKKSKPSSQAHPHIDLPEYQEIKQRLQATGEYNIDGLGRFCQEKQVFNKATGEFSIIQTPSVTL